MSKDKDKEKPKEDEKQSVVKDFFEFDYVRYQPQHKKPKGK